MSRRLRVALLAGGRSSEHDVSLASPRSVLAALDPPADVILMDVRMPGRDGIDACAELTAGSDSKVIILTTFDLDEYVFEALRVGASGFLVKDTEPVELIQAVRAPRLAAAEGGTVRVRVPAREVSLSLGIPQGSSILNILPGRIVASAEGDPGRGLVQLELEGVGGPGPRLLSRISRYSWERLGLSEGMRVQAQIKSMGLARDGSWA